MPTSPPCTRRWDLRALHRFVLAFGALSALVDLLTFATLLWAFDAGPGLLQSGWFVETVAAQALILVAVRARPHPLLAAAALACAAAGVAIPFSPLGSALGLTPPPPLVLLALAGLIAASVATARIAMMRCGRTACRRPLAVLPSVRERTVRRWTLRWTAS